MGSFVERVVVFLRTQRDRRWWRWRKRIAISLLLFLLVLGRHRLAAEYHYLWIVADVSSGSTVGHMQDLEHLGHDGAIAPLLRFARSRDVFLREFAARALGNCRGRRVVDALIRLAREDPDENTQTRAIQSLGEIADPRALPTLRELATRRASALDALVFFGELGKQALLGQVRGELGPDWRAGALNELCGYYKPTVFLSDQAVRQEVRQRLFDKSWEVRAAAAQCVAKMAGAPKSEWVGALLEDPEPMVRLEAASQLGKLGDRSGFEAASRILADVTLDQEVRARAALTLRDIGDPRVRGFLCKIARSGAPFRVVDMCKTALANLFDKGTQYDESMCNEATSLPPRRPAR